jgi:hypothetical protein
MKKNISIFGLLAAILLAFNVSSASADPTYAVLDTNGNVTNIIVCGSACASGEFGGNKVVLQVAADPVTGENRGGIWQGQGTTAYNENTGVFTVTQNPVLINSDVNNDIQNISSTTIINTDTEERKNIKTTSSVNIVGEVPSISFKYEDTIGDNLFTRNRFIKNWADNSQATISVNVEQTITTATVANGVENILSTNTENNVESISFDSRKTAQEIQDFVTNSNLLLLNSKVQTLISLLGSWVK